MVGDPAVPAGPGGPALPGVARHVARAAAAGNQLAGSSTEQLAKLVDLATPAVAFLGRHLRRAGWLLSALILLAAVTPVWFGWDEARLAGAGFMGLITVIGLVAAWVPALAAWRAHRAMVSLSAAIRAMPGDSSGYLRQLSGTLVEIRDQEGSTLRNAFRFRHLRKLGALAERVGLDDVLAISKGPALAFAGLVVTATIFGVLVVAGLAGLALTATT